MLATLLSHVLRRRNLCRLTVKNFKYERRSVVHLKVERQRRKNSLNPAPPAASNLIHNYLQVDGRGDDADGTLFRPVKNDRNGKRRRRDHGRYCL